MLISEYCPKVNATLKGVLNGTIKELNYKSKNISTSSGGALAKSVPKPKDMFKESNQKYVENLSTRELVINGIYEEIREKNDASLLIKYLKEGKLKSSEKDGKGMCPLIFAVDCSFDLEIIKELVELGCDPYSVDDNGDTLLHYAVSLENEEVEKWLLNEYKLKKDTKNNDGLTAYD